MGYVAYFVGAIILLFLIAKLLAWPLKILCKLLINGVLGAILLLVFNFFGGYFGLSIAINTWTVLVAGFCGVPGVIFLIIFKMLL